MKLSLELSAVTVIRPEELGIRGKLFCDGGPTVWAELMGELRDASRPETEGSNLPTSKRLQATYEKVMAKMAKG